MLETLERIYREHRQGLFSVALSITRDADRAEDAVHDAFARLYRSDSKPSGDPVSYVFAAVRNAAIDVNRKRTEPTVDISADITPTRYGQSIIAAASDASPLEFAESQNLIQRAIDSLPQAQREVLIMKLYSELTFDQIGQVRNEPLSTVASRYRRALEHLKGQLAGVARQ